MFGYTGKILHVNLTTKTIDIETPDEQFYKDYVGGSLLGLYYLWKFAPTGVDALAPENVLTFAVSPTTGLPVSGQSRCTATTKSPSSGGVADSQAGGFFPAELKYAGFDAVIIQGASDTPVYLWIKDGKAELRDASHLWGKLTYDVDQILEDELDDKKIEIAQIGIAGEKLANFAAVINMSNRAWGRTGVGAVMGSKKLKAIVVRGSQRVTPADRKPIMDLAKKGAKRIKDDEFRFGKYGTAGVVTSQQGAGGLPTFNYNSGAFPALAQAEAIGGERLYDELLRGAEEGKQDKLGRDTCYACAVRCKRVAQSEYKDKAIVPEYGGPEYETLATFGSYCGITDIHAVTYANQLCNAYGVDTISCGATIAWAFECYENGLLTTTDTDGLELTYGNTDAMIALLEKTLNREGFGDILANGSAKAADILGKGHEYLITVKGQELPAHMPQVKRGLGLIYAVNPFGADHESSEHDTGYSPRAYKHNEARMKPLGLTSPTDMTVLNEDKVEFMYTTQCSVSALDTLGLCTFVFGASWQLYSVEDIATLLEGATGWDIGVDEVLHIGAKRINLMRAYNAREGLQRDKDTLPEKMFTKALLHGRTEGVMLSRDEFETALDMYYDKAGWDVATGTPTRASLEAVDLAWVADDMGL
ncbi:MAG: aldehyde ferredoxin oxidoreductase family protein [Chloroflexota bacterium]